ncbi:MAG: hypothetical protein QOG64_914, partial [Acidimicrobiaceae bacterium]|nr:hypothetical protein [Acidimicrobiaceae bacterium]
MRISVRRFSAVAISLGLLGSFAITAISSQAGAVTAFGTPKVVSPHDDSEPGIDVAPDGTLYINAPVGVLSNVPGSPSEVWRSTNTGTSWTLLPQSTKANLPGGGDSDIAIDPKDGSLYETDLWLGDSTVSVSHDKGQTWLANPLQGLPVQDRQWVASTGGGIVYHAVHQVPTGIVVSKSLDGLVYPVSTVAATVVDQTGCVCPPGNIIAEAGAGAAGTSD